MKPARGVLAIAVLAGMTAAGWWLGSRPGADRGSDHVEQGLLLGRVVAAAGSPLPADCTLEARSASARQTASVSPEGSFRAVLPAGPWSVRAAASDGQVSDWTQADLPAGAALELTLQLRRMRVVQGVVQDAAGNPLRDFGVVLMRDSGGGATPPVAERERLRLARSSDTGRFQFPDLDEARYFLHAGAPDRAAGPVVDTLSLPFGEAGDVVVLADEIGQLNVRILSELGLGVPDVQVRLVSMGNGAAERRRTTDGSGLLEFEELQCGQWTLVAESPRGSVPPEPVEVRPGVQNVEFKLQRDLESRKRARKE